MATFSTRPLNADERRILARLLSVEFPGVEELRLQLPHATVVGNCECGCATVYLRVDAALAPPCASRSPLPVEGNVVDADGVSIAGILVFVGDGYLGTLEIYGHDDPPVASWPVDERWHVTRGFGSPPIPGA